MFKRKTLPQQAKQSQRDLNSNIRDVERELQRLKRDEEDLVKEIRAAANSGNQASVKILAQNLVRLRNQKERLLKSSCQLKGIRTDITAAASTAGMASTLEKAGKATAAINNQMNPTKVMQSAQAFAKQEMQMEMKQDAVASALDNDVIDEESSDLMAQVLDEIGLETAAKLQSAPLQKQRIAAPVEAEEEDELATRLAALR